MPDVSSSSIPLILAGVALATLGFARLTGLALPRMPRTVGALVVAGGLAVATLGVALPRVSEPAAAPSVTLQPEPSGEAQATPAAVGSITGRVLDARDRPLPGREVVLRRFRGTEQELTQSIATDAQGGFRFGGLPIGPTIAHTVTTDFSGTTFRSDLIVLEPHARETRADLRVAPPTTDPSVIRVVVDSTTLVGDERAGQVLQILRVRNGSRKAYTPGLRLPLLEGASGFEARTGVDRTRLRLDDDGRLVSIAPVLPGLTEVVYTYVVPVPRSGLAVRRTFDVPTRRFELLIGGALRATRTPDLRPQGEVRVPRADQAGTLMRYAASDLRAGASREATVVADAGGDTVRTAVIAGGVIAAVLVVVVPLLRRRRRSSPSPAASDPSPVDA
jgi:hypothetical protein